MNNCACDLQYYIIVNKSTNYIIITNTVLAESAILSPIQKNMHSTSITACIIFHNELCSICSELYIIISLASLATVDDLLICY